MSYIYQRIAKPINYRDIIGEIAGEDFPDQDEWNLQRWKKYYQDDYDWYLKRGKPYDAGSLEDETSVASRVLRLHPELKGSLDINYPDYFEELANEDSQNDGSNEIEKDYNDALISHNAKIRAEGESKLEAWFKKNYPSLQFPLFNKSFHYEDGEFSGSLYPTDQQGNSYRISDHFSDVTDGTKTNSTILHKGLNGYTQQAETEDDNYAILDDSDNKFAPSNNHDDVEITRLVNYEY